MIVSKNLIQFYYMIKEKILDIILGILSPLLVVSILYLPIIVTPGIPFYGDVTYYMVGSNSYYNSLERYLYPIGDIPLTLFSYGLPFFVFSLILGPEAAVKLYIVLFFSLSGTSMYFAIKILSNELFNLYKKQIAIASFLGSLFYIVVFSSGIIEAVLAPSWPYATFPLSFAFLIRFINRGNIGSLLALSILSILGNTQPIWIYYMVIAGTLYLIFRLILGSNIYLVIKRGLVAFITVFSVNAFWILPTVAGWYYGAGGIYSTYTTSNLITFDSLRTLSHWTLLDVIMVGEHEYYFFWQHPQNYTPLNVAVPIMLAISLFIWLRDDKKENRIWTLYFAILWLLGVFLTKGVHEPAGYVYYWIAEKLPYGAGAILRNPTKFVSLVNFAYAILIALLIVKIYNKLTFYKKVIRYSIILFLMMSVIVPVLYGTLIDLQAYTWVRYKPTYVPSIYYDLNSWLSHQPDDFKVMWIPSGEGYVWKPFIITDFPDKLSAKPTVSFTTIYPNLLFSTRNVSKVLRVLGVKYVIYHGDSLVYPNEMILNNLIVQNNLISIIRINYTFLAGDNFNVPIPITEGEDFKFSNSPFVLISPSYLPRGKEVTIVVRYKIPIELAERGYRGRFWDGFNIGINIYEAGHVENDKRILWTAAYKQEMINETDGYAFFNITVPYTYPTTAVDIYAYFYGCCFKPLTPNYFLGRFLVVPRTIEVPFVVFENRDYSGPLYVTHLAVAEEVDLVDILNSQLIDTKDYSVIFTDLKSADSLLEKLGNIKLFIYSCLNATSTHVEKLMNSTTIFCMLPNKYFDTIKGKNISIIKEGNRYISIRLNNTSLNLKLYAPRNGTYFLYLRASGNLSINGTELSCDVVHPCNINLKMNKGYNNVVISTNGTAYIYSIYLINYIHNVQNLNAAGKVIKYWKESPVHWHVIVNASEPFVLVFTEPYDRAWRAYVNGKEVVPVPIYNLVNGFIINDTGLIHIEIYYLLQKYYTLGMAISGATLLGLSMLAILPQMIRVRYRKFEKVLNA